MAIDLGLFLSDQHPPGRPPAEGVREHLEQVAAARELGYTSIWAGQHFLSQPFAMYQSIPMLARVAAEAEGMTVGAGVLLLTLLNPLEVAENVATLDAICDGRFVLGVGFGYRDVENAAFGISTGRVATFEAKLDVVRRLLAGERVTARGEGYVLTDAELALRSERPPPIWMAANGDRAVQRAARLSDAWLVNPHTRLDELERQVGLFHAARAEAGLAPVTRMPVIKEICVAETDEAALAAARPYLEGKYDAYVAWGQSDVLPEGDTLRRAFAELTAGGRFVIGSPQTCAAILAEHVARLGVDHIICRAQWPGMPQEHVLRTLRLLAHEVAPRLGP
ncbi:LLM class flavin-dependent oxidoreductase [Baekduia soli]|uniref:LLM class flavin-dependent oxidoreductase n=1 Tax=Baekduia soli TaxID=496014 RepID=A0A5B8U5L9_9ACTN|nr:LLM class flavin-dependent oxidoreductase [Baekduia soli]QEC48419.1 LLM class flavin-dependent oxidoreductase [Baekduia soli]